MREQFFNVKSPSLFARLFSPITTLSNPLSPINPNSLTLSKQPSPISITFREGTSAIATLLNNLIEPPPTRNSINAEQFLNEKSPSLLVKLSEPISTFFSPRNASNFNSLTPRKHSDPTLNSPNSGTPSTSNDVNALNEPLPIVNASTRSHSFNDNTPLFSLKLLDPISTRFNPLNASSRNASAFLKHPLPMRNTSSPLNPLTSNALYSANAPFPTLTSLRTPQFAITQRPLASEKHPEPITTFFSPDNPSNRNSLPSLKLPSSTRRLSNNGTPLTPT